MASRKPRSTQLSPDDWAAAALEALGRGGLVAVAVEPLAVQLGATKGSLYWHFRDRAALLDAALALWEKRGTDDVIAELEQLAGPADRLRALFVRTHARPDGLGVEAVLLAECDNGQVRPVLDRVTRRRLDYMAGTLVALGASKAEATHRALLAYQTWIGYVQLIRATPGVMPSGAELEDYLAHVMVTLEGSGFPPGEPLAP